jgi:hypothetical protein
MLIRVQSAWPEVAHEENHSFRVLRLRIAGGWSNPEQALLGS